VARLILNCTSSLFGLARRARRARKALAEPREEVSRCYRVPRKLIIAGGVVNAIIDLLFIKSNRFVSRVYYIRAAACRARARALARTY